MGRNSMKEIIDYPTRFFMKAGKKDKHSQGLRSLHTDFINNDESQGYRVTFVDGIDDPNNEPKALAESEKNHTRKKRTRDLTQKLDDDTITDKEVMELSRLRLK